MKKPQAFSRCGSPGFLKAPPRPGAGRLIEVLRLVESKMAILERNRQSVAQLKHATERDGC